ncbi:MAG: hypothetical protein LUE92_12180 [Clostridiales bacterium]|nr:hypothetical protein [Clostridiales bacterium]
MAEELSELSVDGLTAVYTNGTWSANMNSIVGSVTGEDGTCSNSSTTGTLVFTNNSGADKLLTFDYDITLNDGSCSLGSGSTSSDTETENTEEDTDTSEEDTEETEEDTSESMDGSGSYSVTLADGGTLQIVITSGEGSAYTTTISLTNICLLNDSYATVTFLAPENGSYTVDGVAITEDVTYTRHSSESFAVEAKATTTGYKFSDWRNTESGTSVSINLSGSLYFDSDVTIAALFVEKDVPLFNSAGSIFTDLNEAADYATENAATTIQLISSGTLPSDSVVPEGICLSIPMDANMLTYTTECSVASTSVFAAGTSYMTLIVPEDVTLTVYGTIAVNGKQQTGAIVYSGWLYGDYGALEVNGTLEIYGILAAWGYVYGDGLVIAKDGATVYQMFGMKGWRGGSATSTGIGSIFPINDFGLANIACKSIYEYGSILDTQIAAYAVSTIYTNKSTSTGTIIIGTKEEGGIFVLSEGASITIDFNWKTTQVSISGDVVLAYVTVAVAGVSITSSDYILPIPEGWHITVESGAVVEVQYSCKLQPGSSLTVAEGGTLTIAEGAIAGVWGAEYDSRYDAMLTISELPAAILTVNGTLVNNGVLCTSDPDIGNIASDVYKVSASGETTEIKELMRSGSGTSVSVTAVTFYNVDFEEA